MVRQRSAKPLFAGSIPAVASNILRIPTPADFAFEPTVESHGWYRLAPFRWSRRERVLRRAESFRGRTVDLEIRFSRRTIVVSGGGTGDELRKRIIRMLQLDVDLGEFHALARESTSHSWAARTRFGRLLCGTTLFEDIVKIIATTNTRWAQTVKMAGLLVEKCGRPTRTGARTFPAPEDIAAWTVDDLQRECRLGYRARFIHSLATGVASGAINLQALSDPALSTDELFERYQTLPGIGPYGAAHLLAMDGRHDFIAVDTEFRRFVRETYHRGRGVADRTMLRRYATWGRWKYLAYWSELWRSVAGRLQP